MYKLRKNGYGVIRLADGARIPFAESNRDYEDYLKWIAAGGIVQPAQTPAEIDTETTSGRNAALLAQLEANDKKIIRALVEGDTVRINAFKTAQATLRAQLNPPVP